MNTLKRFFTFPFEGPDWPSRFLIGAGLLLAGFVIPILPAIIVLGYVLQVMRQAIEGESLTLPPWEDWSRLAVDGLRLFLINLVFFLPGMIISFGGITAYFMASIALPLSLESAGPGSGMETALPFLFLAAFAAMFFSLFLGSLLLMLGVIPLPAAVAHFAAQDRAAAAFHVSEWWPILRANKLGYFIDWVIIGGLFAIFYYGFLMAYYTLILCCFLPILTAPFAFYVSLVSAALFGHSYREGADLLAAAEQRVPA
ncbi:MAG: DUF4013 domain-containing protein [Anaerolineae bacterium]